MSTPEISRTYDIEEHKRINLQQLNRSLMSYTIETKEESKKSDGDSDDSYDNDLLSNEQQSSYQKYIKHSQQSVDGSEGQSLLQVDHHSSLENAKRSEEGQDEASVDLKAQKLQ